jgi:hypothetical protein
LLLPSILFAQNSATDGTGSIQNKGGFFGKIQNSTNTLDSRQPKNDTLSKLDTLKKTDTVNVNYAESEIKTKINYKAEDSIVYDIENKKMYLYNDGDMDYDKIKLKADSVEFDWNTFTLSAGALKDSNGVEQGKPVFTESGKEFKAGRMAYNFKSKKGKVYEVTTQEGEAFIHSEAVKRADENSWYGFHSKYTTCDLDHPHFYFQSKKTKIVPNKVMVTGPTNFWVGDVPTPLYLPFGIFPIKQGRRSGLVIPKPGERAGFGFFLQEGGYFWAVNDQFSLKFTGDIYSNGSFGIHVGSQYKVNYKFSGSLKLDYLRIRAVDPDLPGAQAQNNFQLNWQFALDPKAAPTNSFSANVSMASSSYNKANGNTSVDINSTTNIVNTSFNSNINYSKTFSRAPFLYFSIAASHSQNVATKQFSITFPLVRFGVQRVTPFKAKISSGKPKWYESIGLSYGFEAKNTLATYDSILFTNESLKRMRYGINQNVTIDAPFTLFKYLNVTPSARYNERWYFQTINKTWVNKDQEIRTPGGQIITIPGFASYLKTDTVTGFKAARDFDASISFGTKVIGIYNFKGKYLKALRHIFTPQISAVYHPDFSTKFWGNYDSVRANLYSKNQELYNRFDIVNSLYGSPQIGMVGSLRWALNNNFDMKVFSKKDTVNHERKLGILERFNISGGYNFAAKQFKLENFAINGSMRIWENITANFNVDLDPYSVDSTGKRVNTFYWNTHHQLLRFNTANFSVNANFHSKPHQANKNVDMPARPKFLDYISTDPDEYYHFDIPWTFNLSYNFRINKQISPYTQRDSLILVQAFTFNGDFNLTPKWKIAFNSGVDIKAKTLTITTVRVVRNLHCWELSFNWTAYPLNYQQFVIDLHVLSSTLKDLKVTKRSLPNNAF